MPHRDAGVGPDRLQLVLSRACVVEPAEERHDQERDRRPEHDLRTGGEVIHPVHFASISFPEAEDLLAIDRGM